MHKDILLYSLLAIVLLFGMFSGFFYVRAVSPSFSHIEIRDNPADWINMKTRQYLPGNSTKEYQTDILAVDYFSNGRILNATLWLAFPFIPQPSNYAETNYGMLIDSDFDKNTGYDGVDYQLQIQWQNKTKTWEKVLTAWSPNKKTKIVSNESNYTGFFGKDKRNYVDLSLDLSLLNYPKVYKVTFYAETRKSAHDALITDFTRTVAIPPLHLDIGTTPTSLFMRPGQVKTINIQVNSTQGYEPTVYLYTANQSGDIISSFKNGFGKLRIPTYGLANAPLTIQARENASDHPYTLFIFANSSFPAEKLINVKSTSKSPTLIPNEESENITKQTTMLVTVGEKLSALDVFSDLWNKLGGSITFFYGILAGISPYIFSKLKSAHMSRPKKETSTNNRTISRSENASFVLKEDDPSRTSLNASISNKGNESILNPRLGGTGNYSLLL